ncbi:ZPR1 zinc-finger domain-containing protein [Amylocarpus encephaloides]|uniref:ZPR1 zinc-finger domain-containing protein n=1 Tax=Amylocarpus encephaloides TaxID=45428 RepID=A0A9P8C9U3_9HELO|nr:ZPR1 zinc-finger domain-containing protein [Amylocarpus encephaloides]
MADHPQEDPKPDGAAFDRFFDSIGNKAENLTPNRNNDIPSSESNPSAVEAKVPEEEQKVVDEIESLCMNCRENGITRLLLTRIPFFREIIIMSFYCPHCSFKNSQIQSAGEIQQKGSRFELRLTAPADFERQVVKSDTCVVKFTELDLEVPAGRGQLTNIEGILGMIMEDLAMHQDARKEQMPEAWAKVDEILAQGKKMIAGEAFPFRVSLDDPAGNSWIEPDHRDGVGKWSKIEYARTPEQNEELGLGGNGDEDQNKVEGQPQVVGQPTAASFEDDDVVPNEVYSFPAACPGCARHCVTHMKMVDIPHFKQVIIMSTVCELCGYRSNEVKTGGAIPELGKKITLKVENSTDLARDILKSESCALECPELSLQVNPGTLGGRFTTVEGLLTNIRDDLHQQIFDVDDASGEGGDSLESETKMNWKKFFDGVDAAIKGEKKFTVILQDPLAGSYVQNLCLPEKDPQLEEEDYKRTEEEEEDLGLADMVTEGYEEITEPVAEELKKDLEKLKIEGDKKGAEEAAKCIEKKVDAVNG